MMEKKKEIKELMEKGYKKYQYGEYKEAIENFNQATSLAQGNNLIKEECIAIKMEATALYRLARYKDSVEKYNIALEIAKKNGFKKQECRIYNHLIALYEMLNDYDKAKECMDKGIELAVEINDLHSQAKLLNSKGVYFHIFGNDKDALKCYEGAMDLYKKLNDKRGLGTSCNLIAGYYYLLEDYNESLNYYQKANEIGKNLPDFDMMALSTCRTGLIYYKINDTEKALELLQDPIFLEEKIENKKIVVEVYYVKGLIYKTLNKRDLAKENFESAIQLADNIGGKYLTARIYKELGIFFLEGGKAKKAYDYLKKSVDIFNLIREKIGDKNLRKQFKDSFQDILELIWSLSKIILNFDKEEDISEIQYIKNTVLNLCKITNNHSTDYALKLQTKIMTKSIVKKFSTLKSKKDKLEKSKFKLEQERKNLIFENEKLKEKVEELKKKIRIFEKKFEVIKKNPEIYKGLDEEYLKDFINTEIWSDSKDQLIKNYFSDVFDNLAERSKNDLIFMKVIFNIMKTGYEICAFLLTKAVERELRRYIFKNFKLFWRNKLNECDFSILYNNKKFFNSNPELKEKILKTNKIFLDYLSDKYSLVLGNISAILREISHYCKYGDNKRLILGWEKYFLLAFRPNLCTSIFKILDGLYTEIPSKNESIRFIDLRNLVSHADDVEPEIITYKEIEFDESFIENLLEFMTVKDPRLLIEICGIEPVNSD